MAWSHPQSLPQTPPSSARGGLRLVSTKAAPRPWSAVAGAPRIVRQQGKAWPGLDALSVSFAAEAQVVLDLAAPHPRLLVALEIVGGALTLRGAGAGPAIGGLAAGRAVWLPEGAAVALQAERVKLARLTILTVTAPVFGGPALPAEIRDGLADPRLIALARLADGECARAGEPTPGLGDGLALGLRAILADAARPACGLATGGLGGRRLHLVLAAMEAAFPEAVPPGELARLAGLSTSHFQRSFKTATGQTLGQWLLQRRVGRARELMLQPGAALAQVALDTGFSDQPHFTRVFSRLAGESPGAWRRSVMA